MFEGWGLVLMIPIEFLMIAVGGYVGYRLEDSGHKIGSYVFIGVWTLIVCIVCMIVGSWGLP